MRNTGTDWSYLDRGRRRRREWMPRGLVFAAIRAAGGEVDEATYQSIVSAAGYRDARAVNRFLVGDPEPVLERRGGMIRLTSRGRSAAEFFTAFWLPRLRTGEVEWPTPNAPALVRSGQRAARARGNRPEAPLRLTAAVTHESPWYVARCLEVEVASQGRSIEDALANLREALELYFEDSPDMPLEPPIIAPVTLRT